MQYLELIKYKTEEMVGSILDVIFNVNEWIDVDRLFVEFYFAGDIPSKNTDCFNWKEVVFMKNFIVRMKSPS